MTSPKEQPAEKVGHTARDWSICPQRTVEGEMMIVAGEGHKHGLIAVVTADEDAHLIAAAPDLLKTLQIIAAASQRAEGMFGGRMSDVTRMFEQITRVSQTAILKAEGKS